jgi:hypothetical protein
MLMPFLSVGWNITNAQLAERFGLDLAEWRRLQVEIGQHLCSC